MASAICPDCERKIEVGDRPKTGQLVTCPHCSAELEVISTMPLELDWAYGDFEDDDEEWDEEEWEDDEDEWEDEDDEDVEDIEDDEEI